MRVLAPDDPDQVAADAAGARADAAAAAALEAEEAGRAVADAALTVQDAAQKCLADADCVGFTTELTPEGVKRRCSCTWTSAASTRRRCTAGTAT